MSNTAFFLRRLSTILAVTILTLTLIGVTSGILLAFYYQPSAGGAYSSLKDIDQTIPYGWLVHTMHNISGNLLIVLALVQIVVMFLGERFRRSWLVAWISGIFLTLSAIGLSWTAMILSWDQLGFWRFRIELGTIEALPLIGPQLRDALTGGAVSTITVEHLYTLHSYLISVGATGLAIVHLIGLLFQEKEVQEEKLAIAAAQAQSESDSAEEQNAQLTA
ncbi:MAG: cytochrome b N-terminal domain-containing protein [Myxacorys californica WJT36-NPBG1]|jgi:cytochrome b6|nr:cytochrome b N-terminal domain-containing protein [Myxacorys californica WJT36-NPBG1]